MVPFVLLVEADDGRAAARDLPVPDPPTRPTISPLKYVEIEIVVDDVVAELRAHAAQLQHDVAPVAA